LRRALEEFAFRVRNSSGSSPAARSAVSTAIHFVENPANARVDGVTAVDPEVLVGQGIGEERLGKGQGEQVETDDSGSRQRCRGDDFVPSLGETGRSGRLYQGG